MARSTGRTDQDRRDRKSLLQLMEKHMTDDQGKIVHEAVELCLSITEFLGEINAQIVDRYQNNDAKNAGIVASFYMTMVTERGAQELFNASTETSELDEFIRMFKADDTEFGIAVQKNMYGHYHDIMKNEFFKLDASNVVLRVLLAESVMRIIGVCTLSQEDKDKALGFSNALCSYHYIAMTAYLVSGNLNNYFGMYEDSERYFYSRFTQDK